ncbi:QueT transporter family protein [Alkalicella caledoniensis]|uniref:QueT transporter family protein n=1 Tax=Alkalicella caledoniensis TaxID=2731377 RepID=A0A7G9W7E9_ALKCA|nr:QueT transporter family protein [Alkalicella caledoniensis]QNO14611.1 QueT transporter family protein [Alkalicella caledoniensis]
MKNTKFLVQGALIAAVYVVITLLFAPISYGPMQVRISEAMTVLPILTPAAIPGLFVGALIANLFSDAGLLDVVFGSLASLIAAYLTYLVPRSKLWLAPLPPVLVNVIIIPIVLYFAFDLPYWLMLSGVFTGQMIACYGLGYPLLLALTKLKK